MKVNLTDLWILARPENLINIEGMKYKQDVILFKDELLYFVCLVRDAKVLAG